MSKLYVCHIFHVYGIPSDKNKDAKHGNAEAFSNNCCSIISAQLCLFCLFCLRSWEENGSFWIKSECHPVIWSESICPYRYDQCCVSHTFCFSRELAERRNQVSATIAWNDPTNVLNGEKPAESPSVSMATEIGCGRLSIQQDHQRI